MSVIHLSSPTAAVLLVLLILELKHFVCDYPLQRPFQLLNKGTYGHIGGILHSSIHVAATLLAFLVITPSFLMGAGIIIGEFLVHYHIDWTKEQFMRRMALTSGDDRFWFALGFDQLLHHLTYLGIATILWLTAGGA